jgi:general stress protein 13/S1 RNA binding domain protein
MSQHDLHAVDQNIAKLSRKTPDNLKLHVQPVLPPTYKKGERLQARIQHIVPYGAFAEILDGKHLQGLIHIKHISDTFITDIHDWLEIGQELEVEVIEITSDNKIGLSVTHLQLKPLKEIKQGAFANQLQNLVLPNKLEAQDKIEFPQETNEELDKIYNYLEKHLGCVSSASKKIIETLVKEQGIFTFSMVMIDTLKQFHLDMSLLFVKEIQKKMRDGL